MWSASDARRVRPQQKMQSINSQNTTSKKKSNSKFQSEPEIRKKRSAIGYELSPVKRIHPIVGIYCCADG
jgi:hypothetical protein